MQGILKAYAAAGLNQKQFGAEVDIDHRLLSKFVNGEANPTPPQLGRISARSGLPPQAIATAEKVDYGIPVGNVSKKHRKADKRKNPCRLQTRADIETDFAFRALCYEEGVTVSDKLLELVRAAISAACNAQMREVG